MEVDDVRAFLAVAHAGSLSAVAKLRGVAVSTIARRLDGLEASLKVRLLDRRRDGVRLTLDGQRLLSLGQATVDNADRMQRLAQALGQSGQDRLVVTGTEAVLSEILAPALPKLFAAAPDVRIDLRSDGAVISLAAREADLAVRMLPPEGASLLARKLGVLKLGLFAHPTYLATAAHPLDLAKAHLLGYDDAFGRLPELNVLREAGLADALIFSTNSTRALLTAAAAGTGIALLPEVLAIPAGLVAVPGPEFRPRVPYLVVHRDQRRRRDVSLVHAWIVRVFANLVQQR